MYIVFDGNEFDSGAIQSISIPRAKLILILLFFFCYFFFFFRACLLIIHFVYSLPRTLAIDNRISSNIHTFTLYICIEHFWFMFCIRVIQMIIIYWQIQNWEPQLSHVDGLCFMYKYLSFIFVAIMYVNIRICASNKLLQFNVTPNGMNLIQNCLYLTHLESNLSLMFIYLEINKQSSF